MSLKMWYGVEFGVQIGNLPIGCLLLINLIMNPGFVLLIIMTKFQNNLPLLSKKLNKLKFKIEEIKELMESQ